MSVDGRLMPKRIHRKRVKGWRMPPNTVVVNRPSRWGNIYRVGSEHDGSTVLNAAHAVELFRDWVTPHSCIIRDHLRGKNLACYCKLCPVHADGKPLGVECLDCQPCHADILLELANADAD
jgi:hypothetical protein